MWFFKWHKWHVLKEATNCNHRDYWYYGQEKGYLVYDYFLKLPEIQKLDPIAPKQEKNLNLRLQKRNGKNGRKARSKGCLIETDNLQ